MPTTLNLTRLSDHQLLASARELAQQERVLNLQIIDHLIEIGARGLHLRHGYSSLFAYAVKELGVQRRRGPLPDPGEEAV